MRARSASCIRWFSLLHLTGLRSHRRRRPALSRRSRSFFSVRLNQDTTIVLQSVFGRLGFHLTSRRRRLWIQRYGRRLNDGCKSREWRSRVRDEPADGPSLRSGVRARSRRRGQIPVRNLRNTVGKLRGKRRCRLHGGLSTGPKTPAGRARIAESQRSRWARFRSAKIARPRAVTAVRPYDAHARHFYGFRKSQRERLGPRHSALAGRWGHRFRGQVRRDIALTHR